MKQIQHILRETIKHARQHYCIGNTVIVDKFHDTQTHIYKIVKIPNPDPNIIATVKYSIHNTTSDAMFRVIYGQMKRVISVNMTDPNENPAHKQLAQELLDLCRRTPLQISTSISRKKIVTNSAQIKALQAKINLSK